MIICHLFVLKKMPPPACPPMARATIEIDYFFNSNCDLFGKRRWNIDFRIG